jgi:hypothetical protein
VQSGKSSCDSFILHRHNTVVQTIQDQAGQCRLSRLPMKTMHDAQDNADQYKTMQVSVGQCKEVQ